VPTTDPGSSSPITLGQLKAGLDVSGEIYAFSASNPGELVGTWEAKVQDASVPEPGTMLLFGSGLAGLAVLKKKSRAA
jgi:hypothetical protein